MYLPILIYCIVFQDKSAVYKLFQVLVPRYQDYTTSYTRLFYAPRHMITYEEMQRPVNLIPKTHIVCVELKGHPYPPLSYSNTKPNKRHIHNVLLSEAKRDLESGTI